MGVSLTSNTLVLRQAVEERGEPRSVRHVSANWLDVCVRSRSALARELSPHAGHLVKCNTIVVSTPCDETLTATEPQRHYEILKHVPRVRKVLTRHIFVLRARTGDPEKTS